jgi:hypothetical protein
VDDLPHLVLSSASRALPPNGVGERYVVGCIQVQGLCGKIGILVCSFYSVYFV